MKPSMENKFNLEVDVATRKLRERLRNNPEAVKLLNDILEVWMESGAEEDFDYYLSNLMLEAEIQEPPVNPEIYLQLGQNFLH